MLVYVVKRLLGGIPVLLVVITATFFLVRLAPGGPFDTEKAIPEEILKNLNARYHLDEPVYQQFWGYLTHLVVFDFGPSFKFPDRTVTELIKTGMPVTFELGLYAILFSIIVGVVSGVTASSRPNSLRDYIPMSLSMFGICMPSFLLGPLLVLVFALYLGWFPVSGWESMSHKVLPSMTLGSAYAAYISRLSRSGMLEVMSQDYIRTARAKGVPEFWVVVRHALKGGLMPVISFLGPAAAGLLAGSFVVETIFQIPGLGRFYVQAAFNRDYTMIMGTTVFLSALIIFFNIASDVALVALNPRLKYGNEEALDG